MLGIITTPWEHRGGTSIHEGALYAVLDIIGNSDPAFARTIHDDERLPLYSASLESGRLRVGALDDSIIVAIMRSLGRMATLHEATQIRRLLDEASDSATLTLRIVSPMTFRHGGKNDVLPMPTRVFGSLARRWERAGGPPLPPLDFAHVVTSRADLRTVTVRYAAHGFAAPGVLGEVRYHIAPTEYRKAYHALAHFAVYAGVGGRTAQGWGRVEYLR